MKTTAFKVHSIYSTDDIVQMERVATRKRRLFGLTMTVTALVLYAAALIWQGVKGDGFVSVFSFISGSVLNLILILGLILVIAGLIWMPKWRARSILKAVPGGVLKANYYFYERTFQYGWGDTYSTIGYVNIQEFRNLEHTFYLEADGVTYWIKKSDFEVGTPEAFLEYMRGKLKCQILEK